MVDRRWHVGPARQTASPRSIYHLPPAFLQGSGVRVQGFSSLPQIAEHEAQVDRPAPPGQYAALRFRAVKAPAAHREGETVEETIETAKHGSVYGPGFRVQGSRFGGRPARPGAAAIAETRARSGACGAASVWRAGRSPTAARSHWSGPRPTRPSPDPGPRSVQRDTQSGRARDSSSCGIRAALRFFHTRAKSASGVAEASIVWSLRT